MKAQYPGNEVGHGSVKTLEDCQKLCEENKECNSISYGTYGDGSGYCSQYDKCITDSESYLERNWNGYRTYYKDCNGNFNDFNLILSKIIQA